MRLVTRRVLALIVLTTVVTVWAVEARQLPPPPPPPPPVVGPGAAQAVPEARGSGLVVGQVVDASTAKPIGGATVTISSGAPVISVLPTGEAVVTNPTMSGAAGGAPRQVMADAQGRFMFRELAKGRYTFRTMAPGYLAGGLGQTRPTGGQQAVELTSDSEKVGDLIVRMWKSATISGSVVDEGGEPVIGVAVRAIRRTLAGGRPRLAFGTTGTTDDRGIYRIPNLTPGDYFVGVISTYSTMPSAISEAYLQAMMSGASLQSNDTYRELSSSGAPSPSMSGFRVGELTLQASSAGRGGTGSGGVAPAPGDDGRVQIYPTVFYPAGRALAEATLLTLGSGEDRRGIDLHLTLMPAVRVSGTVVGPDGPVRNMGVRLLAPGAEDFAVDSSLDAAAGATDGTGAFTLLAVPPGAYTLKVLRVPRVLSTSANTMTTVEVMGPNGMIMGMSSSGPSTAPPPPIPTDPTLWGTMPVVVGESDLTGLAVQMRTGLRVSGRLEFIGTRDKPAPAQLQRVSISLTSNEPRGFSQVPAVRVEADGRFNTGGHTPGKYQISANVPPAPGGAPISGPAGQAWTIKSVTLGGRNVSDEGLDLVAEDVTGVVITFTDQSTELSGTVTDGSGQPDRTAEVIVFPADSQAWKHGFVNTRRTRNLRPSTVGVYSTSGMPAGDYFIAAVQSDAIAADWQDPRLLEKIAAVATRVTLNDGEKKTQALTTRIIR